MLFSFHYSVIYLLRLNKFHLPVLRGFMVPEGESSYPSLNLRNEGEKWTGAKRLSIDRIIPEVIPRPVLQVG